MEESKSEPAFALDEFGEDRINELRETAEAVGKLATDAEAFSQIVDAFRALDAGRFQKGLAEAGLLPRCHRICRWLCSRHCVFLCVKLCGPLEEQRELDVEEWRQFALTTARIAQDERLLKRLIDAVDKEDVETFRALVTELQLQRFCHQLCHWLCGLKCRWACKVLCPPDRLITRVGSIPVSQIDSMGYASGKASPMAMWANQIRQTAMAIIHLVAWYGLWAYLTCPRPRNISSRCLLQDQVGLIPRS